MTEGDCNMLFLQINANVVYTRLTPIRTAQAMAFDTPHVGYPRIRKLRDMTFQMLLLAPQ